jgi:hypothetical protein
MYAMNRSVTLIALTTACVLLADCNASRESTTKQDAAKGVGSQAALELKATTAQLMSRVLEPPADLVWAVGGSVVTEKGEQPLAPKNEAEWIVVRNAAVTVAETSNLLLLAPHVRDQGDWVAITRRLIDEANKYVQAAEAKDLETMFTAGGDMYQACLDCHAKYKDAIGQQLKK